jgi:hypothetical protein
MGGMNAQMLNQPGTHCYSLWNNPI